MNLKIAIWGYKVSLLPPWDPSNVSSGLPGSEECAVYAAQELSELGHTITVFMNPSKNSLYSEVNQNPRWLPEEDFLQSTDMFDLALLWRRTNYFDAKEKATKVYFWSHDTPNPAQFGLFFPPFDGLILLSEHHRNQMIKIFPNIQYIPTVVSGNGYVPEQFLNPIQYTNPYSIGYYSNYSRGLEVLLSIWPNIKQKYPKATLDVYYGREHWGTMSNVRLENVVEYLNKLDGVIERGKVGHQELADAMCTTSIWAYPHMGKSINSGETFCITAIKAQAAGMIPVVTRAGALNETVHTIAPSVKTIDPMNRNDIINYYNLLVSTLDNIESLEKDRKIYIEFARKFTWNKTVNKWLNFYSASLK
jgi:glycosyltransferase involved in cell wall biosynthesis